VVGRGRQFDPTDARFALGEPSECHENVASLWAAGEGHPCTGFALSEDGLWRSHSWLFDATARVVETTEARAAYYGYEFADAEGAALFASAFTRDLAL
jgi:hypothetical protein